MWSLIFIRWHLWNFKLVHVDIIDFTVRECEIHVDIIVNKSSRLENVRLTIIQVLLCFLINEPTGKLKQMFAAIKKGRKILATFNFISQRIKLQAMIICVLHVDDIMCNMPRPEQWLHVHWAILLDRKIKTLDWACLDPRDYF